MKTAPHFLCLEISDHDLADGFTVHQIIQQTNILSIKQPVPDVILISNVFAIFSLILSLSIGILSKALKVQRNNYTIS